MLRLGHIDYSNCLPVHAALLEATPADLTIVHGSPSELNQALACGAIDVAPCSSIEFARHPQRYRVLPGLAIGARGRVQSIRLESTRPLSLLSGHTVAVPTASATSVVLLRILLQLRFGSAAQLRWYQQEDGADPIEQGAAAALWIGDQALQRSALPGRTVHDLGELWAEWTGLPFVFALWQTGLGSERDLELQTLTRALHASLRASLADPLQLALRHSAQFQLPPERLAEYWTGLQYSLDPAMQSGLTRFYELAVELGEVAALPALRWIPD